MILKNIRRSPEMNTLFLDEKNMEVPNLPYDFPITYLEYEIMLTYFVQKYMKNYLDSKEVEDNGIKLCP